MKKLKCISKKNVEKLLSIFAIFFVAILIPSCKNFMQGKGFIDEIEGAVEYQNKSSSDIYIDGESKAIDKIVPSLGVYFKKLRPTDVLPLSVEINSDYQFIKWMAEPEGSVEFDDPKSLETNAKILSTEASQITIKPVCCLRPEIKSFTPEGIESVEKNSSIKINFSHPMDLTAEDLKRIAIFSEGEDLISKQYFNAPKLNDDKTEITISANVDNLIPIENTTRTIEVTVPSDYSYVDEQFSERITIGQEKKFTYKINSQTTEKLILTFTNKDKNGSEVNLSGDYKMNIGQSQNLRCNVSSGYVFIEWQVFSDGNFVPKSDYSEYFEFDEKLSETILTVKEYSEKQYTIQPFFVERPSIVSVTPTNEMAGVNYDTKIRITFDRDLDKDTIYYSEEEQKAIYAENAGKNVEFIDHPSFDISGYYAYRIDGYLVYKCLSIVDCADQNVNLLEYFSVPEFDNGSSNVLVIKPVSDVLAQRDILITVTPTFGLIQKYSDGSTSKLISFEKKYPWSYRANGNKDEEKPEITSFKLYFADSDKTISEVVDAKEDTFQSNSKRFFHIKQRETNFEYDSQTFVKPKGSNNEGKFNLITKNQSLFIQARFMDSGIGIGLKSFCMEITKVDPDDYEKLEITVPKKFSPQIRTNMVDNLTYNPYLFCSGSGAKIITDSEEGEKIDLSNLQDGVYKIDFSIADKNQNTLEYENDIKKELEKSPTIYFIYDGTPPGKVTNVKEEMNDSHERIISWTNPKDEDIAVIEVHCHSLIETRPYDKDLVPNGNSCKNSWANSEDRFRYSITVYDIFGNSSETVIYEGTTFN